MLCSDIALIVLALPLISTLRGSPALDSAPFYAQTKVLCLASLVAWAVVFFHMRLYSFPWGWTFAEAFSRCFVATAFVSAVAITLNFFWHAVISRSFVIEYFAVIFVGSVGIRYFLGRGLRLPMFNKMKKRVVIIGSGRTARELDQTLAKSPEFLREVVGTLQPYSSSSVVKETESDFSTAVSIPLSTVELVEVFKQYSVDEVILAIPEHDVREIYDLVLQCRRNDVEVSVLPPYYELYTSRPEFIDVHGLPLLSFEKRSQPRHEVFLKLLFDFLGAVLLLAVSLPVVIPAILYLFFKKRQVFASETRCGQYGRPFEMHRLNVARHRIGLSRGEHWLDALSVTEIPQLFNVLKGEMSLVGPRPEMFLRTKHYSEWHKQRLQLRPGLTGLAQIHGLRDAGTLDERATYDLQYMLRSSVIIDVALLLQTVWVVLGRLGQRAASNSGDPLVPPARQAVNKHQEMQEPNYANRS